MGGRGASSMSGNKKPVVDVTRYITDETVKPFSTVSRKQAGMVYRAYKTGEIDVTEQQISMMYKRYTRDSYESPSVSTDSAANDAANKLRATVSAIASGDSAAANSLFTSFLDTHYMHFNDSIFPDDRRNKA